ncbi:MAG: hypothetical protein IT577_15225 [Verrucomicrobiae bacterium]|nr:hypothetical protein [Verrucomicrobiae bacterium]
MKGLLVRVAADQSVAGGRWNGPVDSRTGRFVYCAIPEATPVHPGMNKPYSLLSQSLAALGTILPEHLASRDMHLDPDFEHLTYGDQGEPGKRGEQIRTKLGRDDMLIFYASLRDTEPALRLVYAIIGILVVEEIVLARDTADESRWRENAHTRRRDRRQDIVVLGRPGVSGRLERCIPIGAWRTPEGQPDRRPCYRVQPSILKEWGGLSVRDGFLQKSANLPEFLDPERFMAWFRGHHPTLVQRNN